MAALSIGVSSLLSTIGIAHSEQFHLLNQSAQAETVRFLGDFALGEDLPRRIFRNLTSAKDYQVSAGIKQLGEVLKDNPQLGRKLGESLVLDGSLERPHVLGALLLNPSFLGREMGLSFTASFFQRGLSVHLDQEALDALANADYLREWNLVEPLAEKNFGRVEEYWNDLEARTDEEFQRTYAEILVTLARGRDRYPNNPILRAPIPPPNRIERYHPTMNYLFRPVFLMLGGRYRPFPAYMAAGMVSYIFHFAIGVPLYYFTDWYHPAIVAITCLFFPMHHLWMARRASSRLESGKKRFVEELKSLHPDLPEGVPKLILETELRSEKEAYLRIKRKFFGSRKSVPGTPGNRSSSTSL